MRVLIILISGILITSMALAYFALRPVKRSGTEISVMSDKTDLFKAIPDASDIFEAANMQKNKWSELKINFIEISDFEYDQSRSFYLQSESLMLSNPIERDKKINDLKNEVTKFLQSNNQSKIGRAQSNIYSPLMRELNKLSKSQAANRKLILYSDCRHNTDQFSVYKKADKKRLQENPGEIIKQFEQLEQPGDLTGIKVYIIFQATDKADNESFKIMSDLFKSIIEKAGGEVIIGANLKGISE